MKFTTVCFLAIGSCALLAEAQVRPTLAAYKAGKVTEANTAAAAAARAAKMGAVNKVIDLLESLQKSVLKEGEDEAKSYASFCRYCSAMTDKKTKAILAEENAVASEKGIINNLDVKEDGLDESIGDDTADMNGLAKQETSEQHTDAVETVNYAKTESEIRKAQKNVEDAVKVLKAGRTTGATPSLLQLLSMSKTVTHALMLADALGLSTGPKSSQAQALLQNAAGPEVEMENYKFKSDDIIETLEGLVAQFRETHGSLDETEAKRGAAFNQEMQSLSDGTKADERSIDVASASKSQKEADEATERVVLKTESTNLEDDRKFLSELSAGCAAKARAHTQRTALRASEISAITTAITIIKTTVKSMISAKTARLAQVGSSLHIAQAVANDEQSMEAVEAEAESMEAGAPMSFLQKRIIQKHSSPDMTKQAVASLLKKKGMQLKSTALINLVNSIGMVQPSGLEKVKTLVTDLIERLLSQASAEANHKGWCDKAQGDATQKHEYASEQVEQLTAEIAKLNAEKERLAQTLTELGTARGDLLAGKIEAESMRKTEKAENANTVSEAQTGNAAVEQAVTLISRFYAAAAKEQVAAAPVGTNSTSDVEQVGAFGAAPDAGFGNDQAYKGAADSSSGIVGIMTVISSDFKRTIRATEAAEASAAEDHLAFMTQTMSSISEKTVALTENGRFKDEAIAKLATANGSLKTQAGLVTTAAGEITQLKVACQPKGQTAAERKAARLDEIDALNGALKLFD